MRVWPAGGEPPYVPERRRPAPLRLVVGRTRGAPRAAHVVDGHEVASTVRAYVDRLDCGHTVTRYGRAAVRRRCPECRPGVADATPDHG